MTWYADNLDKKRHCFLGKTGGVSKGKYAGLNVILEVWMSEI